MKKLAKAIIVLLLTLHILTALDAFAGPLIGEELCGDGIDDAQQYIGLTCPVGWVPARVDPLTGSQTVPGCDMLCPAPDKDNDGFPDIVHCNYPTEHCDADDTDSTIHPSSVDGTMPSSGPTIKGCSGGQVHEPLDNGTFTACHAWACPAGRTCHYLSPTGSNFTGDGSIGNPWKSLAKLSYWYFTVTPPFSIYAPINNDLFIMRDGSYTDTFDFGYSATSADVYECRGNTATFGFWAYPGEHPIIDNTSQFKSATWMESCGKQEWKGIQFKTKGTGLNFEGTNFASHNNIMTAPSANGDNLGCFYSITTQDSTSQSDIFYDCYKSALADQTNTANNTNVIDFRSNNLTFLSPTNFYTEYLTSQVAGNKVGLPFKLQKHSNSGSSVTVKRATVFNNSYEAFGSGSPNVLIQYSRFAHGSQVAKSGNYGGPTHQNGSLRGGVAFDFTRNTAWDEDKGLSRSPTKAYNLDGSSAADNCSGDEIIGTFRVNSNNMQTNRTSWDQDNRFFIQDPYIADQLRLISTLSFSNNTYFSANASLTFGINEANNGNVTCAGRGIDGQSYDLTAWHAAGFDTVGGGASVEDCIMDAFQRCTAPGTTDTGWRLLSEEPVGTPTPTPTPTATSTPTPTPTPTGTPLPGVGANAYGRYSKRNK